MISRTHFGIPHQFLRTQVLRKQLPHIRYLGAASMATMPFFQKLPSQRPKAFLAYSIPFSQTGSIDYRVAGIVLGSLFYSTLQSEPANQAVTMEEVYQNCQEGKWGEVGKIDLKEFNTMIDSKGRTLLRKAVEKGDRAIAVKLLELNASCIGPNQDHILHWAISSGQFDFIHYLFREHYTKVMPLIDKPNCDGLTPLGLAASLNEARAIDALVCYGANIEAYDVKNRQTPLHLACLNLASEAIECLIFHNAQLDPVDINHERPEDLISKNQEGLPISKHFRHLVEQKKSSKQLTPFKSAPRNLVFQGGGPKGIAFISALRELENQQVLGSLERLAGTSAGAITAALIACGFKSQQLDDKLSEQKLTDWLDFPKELENQVQFLHELMATVDSDKILKEGPSKSQLFKWGASLLLKRFTLSAAEKKALNEVEKRGGICEGEKFRRFMESCIYEATGIENCTFGELARLIQQRKTNLVTGEPLRHLHVFATLVGSNSKPVGFSSENPAQQDIVISHAIRMSMSIPVVYTPHCIHTKVNGVLKECTEEGHFIDGGLVSNYPIEAFDKQKYKQGGLQTGHGENKWNNPYTWGFSLQDMSAPAIPSSVAPPSVYGVLKSWGQLCYNIEERLQGLNDNNRSRTIFIDNCKVGLLDFDLSLEKKGELLASGRLYTQNFLRQYQKGNIGFSSHVYDVGLYHKKKSDGELFCPRPHPNFSGRSQQLNDLKSKIVSVNLKDKAVVYPLIAPSGYGKSELAITFACKHLKDFSYVWQVDLRNQESFERSYRDLAKTLGVPNSQKIPIKQLAQDLNTKLENLNQNKRPFLIIFDNADKGIPVPLPSKGGCILITRQPVGGEVSTLTPFAANEARELMENFIGKDHPDVDELCQKLQYIPLLIDQAAHYIAYVPGSTASSYLALLNKKSTNGDIALACWKIASSALKEKRPEIIEWITLCAYLNNQNIPKEWLEQWLAKREGQPESQKYYIRRIEILEFLRNYGLVNFGPYDKTFSLHGLLQEAILKDHSESALKDIVSFVTNLPDVLDYNPTNSTVILPFKLAVPHCVSLLEHLHDNPLLKTKLGLTVIRYRIETELNLTQAAVELDRTSEWAKGLSLSPHHGKIAFFYGLLNSKQSSEETNPVRKQELYDLAWAHFEKAKDIFDQFPDSKDYTHLEQNEKKCYQQYQKAICLQYIGQIYLSKGDITKAEKALNDSQQELLLFLKKYPKLYPDGNHFDLARILREKGTILARKKQFNLAIETINQAIEIQRKIYPNFESHSTVAATLSTLADIYCKMGSPEDLDKADALYKHAIQINKRAYRVNSNKYIRRMYAKREAIADLQRSGKADKMKLKAHLSDG